MKQTVEEAAKEYWDSWLKNNPNADKTRIVSLGFAFKAGAEWQSKQSPWISVKERLPEYNIEVIIYHEYRFYVGFMYYSMKSNWWRVNEYERTDMIVSEDDFWMPIPSFDDILEANRDVLERIKQKGD